VTTTFKDAGDGWVWLLDDAVTPRPDALDLLKAHTTPPDGLPQPAILASKVVDADGELHPAHEPWPDIFEKEISTRAAEHRLVSLRATRAGSILVRQTLLDEHGEPHDVLDWTAKILRGETAGYLVPQSVVERTDHSEDGLRHHAKMLLGSGWRPEEKLWLGLLVMQDAVRSRRRAAP